MLKHWAILIHPSGMGEEFLAVLDCNSGLRGWRMSVNVQAVAAGKNTQVGPITVLDPLEDPRWDERLAGHDSSFFHTSAWAGVLHDTYGHRPRYFCRTSDGRLESMLPVMEVSSSLTGKRGVSLPFTDLCPPIKPAGQPIDDLYQATTNYGREQGWRYLECRGDDDSWPGSTPALTFCGHTIELGPDPELLFKRLDSSLRRGIRKAEAAGLQVSFSTGPDAIRTYYALHCGTRRRHGVPPQPIRFFENIARRALAKDLGFVATATFQQQPVAAAVFLHFGRQAIYKFGASDFSFQHLRPNNLLMWESIKRCAASGFASLDMGRTSLGNEGLRRFKLSFGAVEKTVRYFKYDFARGTFVTSVDRAETWANHVFRRLPGPLFRWAGRLLYPHLS